MQKFLIVFAFLVVGTCQLASAQASAVNFKSPSSEDWTLFSDEEHKLFYIDFETLKVNVSDVLVKNEQGDLVWKDNVFNLPVNTIYELDFSNFQTGTYEIELRTFTGTIRKKVAVN